MFDKVTSAMAIFERLSDEGGRITLGWAAERVFYVRFDGTISVDLSERFAQRFNSLVSSLRNVRYFGDSSGVTSYELPGVEVVMAALLAKVEQLETIVVLPWGGALGASARALPGRFARFTFVPSAAELYAELRAAAPEIRIPFAARPRLSHEMQPADAAQSVHAAQPSEAQLTREVAGAHLAPPEAAAVLGAAPSVEPVLPKRS